MRIPEYSAATALFPIAYTIRPKRVACNSKPKIVPTKIKHNSETGIPVTESHDKTLSHLGYVFNDAVPIMTFAIPRNNMEDAIVTITAGICSFATNTPLKRPHSIPVSSTHTMAINALPAAPYTYPITMAHTSIMDAIETSISPSSKIKIMPKTIIAGIIAD